jgi:hypothetical protein
MRVSSCRLHKRLEPPYTADYALAEDFGLELDYSDETSDYRKTTFPARYIYERILPCVVKNLSDIYYHRGSPYSGQGQRSMDQTLGDIHQCTANIPGTKKLTSCGIYDRECLAWITGDLA